MCQYKIKHILKSFYIKDNDSLQVITTLFSTSINKSKAMILTNVMKNNICNLCTCDMCMSLEKVLLSFFSIFTNVCPLDNFSM